SHDQTLHLKAVRPEVTISSPITHYWLLSTHHRYLLSQTTDASPHTNYLFRLLKSGLHTARRQKRKYDRVPCLVNCPAVLDVSDLGAGSPSVPTAHPAKGRAVYRPISGSQHLSALDFRRRFAPSGKRR